MKNKILIFALFAVIFATLFICSVSAADNEIVTYNANDIATCHHNTYVISYNAISASEHRYTVYCVTCHKAYYGDVSSHTGEICDKCGYSCLHINIAYTYEYINEQNHYFNQVCTDCGKKITTSVVAHSYDDKCACACGCVNHSYKEITIIESDESMHKVLYVCSVCHVGTAEIVEHKIIDTVINCVYVSALGHYRNECCADCGEVIDSDFVAHKYNAKNQCIECGVGCKHDVFNDEVCSSCGYLCKHFEYTENIVSGEHWHCFERICDNCGFAVYLYNEPCSYVNAYGDDYAMSVCAVCDSSCTHSYGDDCICDACGYNAPHLFGDGYICNVNECSRCEYVCGHKYIDVYIECEKGSYMGYHHKKYDCLDCNLRGVAYYDDQSCEWQWIYEYVDNNTHNKKKQCLYCFEIVQTISESHTIENGKCILCDGAHNHVITYDTISRYGAPYDRFYCSMCNYEYGIQRNIKKNVPLHYRLKDIENWNIKTDGFVSDKGGEIYQRFTIMNFDNNPHHSASINIYGGATYVDDVGGLDYCRYVVLRIRYKDINTMEFDIDGRNTNSVENLSSLDMRVISNIPISELPAEKWINVVIDLKNIQGRNSSRYSDSVSEYQYMRVITCFQYASENGYVDIDYYAMAQNKAQLDCLLSYSYDEYNSDYYIYNKVGEFQYVDNTHTFKNEKCENCLYKCEHKKLKQLQYIDAQSHGFDEECYYCGKFYNSVSRGLHTFTDNGVTCSECSHKCYHNFKNGYCAICDWRCRHGYENESIKCIYCGLYAKDGGIVYDDGFYDLFTSIYDAQKDTFFSMLGYEILGVNVAGFIISIITLAISLWILKKVI